MNQYYPLFSDAENFYEEYSGRKTLIFFKGIVRQRLLEELTDNIERDPCIEDEVVRGKLLAIFIEISQNVRLHSAEKEISEFEKNGRGFVAITEDEFSFCVSSCNLVDEKSAKLLEARVNYINSLNHEDLREYFRRERRKPKRINSVGSNIGLIDMARRSENRLLIDFKKLNENKLIFSLRVKINKSCSVTLRNNKQPNA